MKKAIAIIVLCCAGCATLDQYSLPLEQRYTRLQWAKMSVHQADAECTVMVQSNPLIGFPTCMQSKGWRER